MTPRSRLSTRSRLATLGPLLIAALASGPAPSREAQAAQPPTATSAPNPTGAPTAEPAPPAPAPEPALPKPLMVKVEWHIKQLRSQLGITPEEESNWDAFAGVMRDNAAAMNATFTDRSDRIGSMDAEDNMESYAHVAQVHAANMQKLSDAFKALYDGFSEAQKKVADDVFRKTNAMKPPQPK